MEPFHQGSLDGLCGIYSVINAITAMKDDLKSDELFEKIIRNLGKSLPRIILHGSTKKDFEKILDASRKYLSKLEVILEYSSVEAIDIDAYWIVIQDHYKEYGPGSIVLSMIGTWNHWSCVKKVTDKSIQFFDSDGLKRLNRTQVAIKKSKKCRYVFLPEETYLLKIRNKNDL